MSQSHENSECRSLARSSNENILLKQTPNIDSQKLANFLDEVPNYIIVEALCSRTNKFSKEEIKTI